jgi:hypothetical protein
MNDVSTAWGALIRSSCKSTGFDRRLSLCTPRAAYTASAGTALARGSAGTARLLTLGRGLLLGHPAHLSLEPPLGPLLGAPLLRGLSELLSDLGSLEVAAEGRVGDVVVAGELSQRLTGRPAPEQLRVGNEPAQSRPALHLRNPLDLLRELRSLEVAAERRVRDVVVVGELPQGLAGRPAPNQLLVGNEPTQSTPALHGRESSNLTHHRRTSPRPPRDRSLPWMQA